MPDDFTDEFADADLMLRDDATFRSTAARKQRPTAEKESQRWVDGYGKALELARELPECEVFSIGDREGDVFEVYQAWLDAEGGSRAEWIIRANQDRALVNVPGGEHPAQDRPGGDPCADDLCGDRLANPLSDTSRAAVPGPALRLRV